MSYFWFLFYKHLSLLSVNYFVLQIRASLVGASLVMRDGSDKAEGPSDRPCEWPVDKAMTAMFRAAQIHVVE